MELNVLLLPSQNPAEHKRLKSVLAKGLGDIPHRMIYDIAQVHLPCRLLVALSLGAEGINVAYLKFLSQLRSGKIQMKSSLAGLVVESAGVLYSKQIATELAFALNQAGCGLVGNPLVEATETLAHFPESQDIPTDFSLELPEYDDSEPIACYIKAVSLLGQRIVGPGFRGKSPLTGQADLPKILVVKPWGAGDAGGEDLSNVSDLWGELQHRLAPFAQIQEFSLRDEMILSCNDCESHHCGKYVVNRHCFYGAALSRQGIYQMAQADALLMLCPSFHNSLHGLQFSFIQQLSPLFVQCEFREKAVFALGVTPYASGDMLANQLISTLCLDYSFYLPPHFALIETAKDPLEALTKDGIEEKLDKYAHGMLQLLSLGNLN